MPPASGEWDDGGKLVKKQDASQNVAGENIERVWMPSAETNLGMV
ncbi:MAG TPA: hypothetical protein VNM47_13985 [Terriglobia bacterium]|nr:hypothetical protein [Terriglobia bacterium]